jgi:hypothetical protein
VGSFQDYLDFLISGVRVKNPKLDTSPGSVIRNILDPVAEMAAQADVAESRKEDWDFATKRGRELDAFVNKFGFSRIPARSAVGNVTISFSTNTTRGYVIPEGTKLYARRGKRLISYSTTTPIGIPMYSAYKILPIRADQPGAVGNARPGEVRTLDYNIEQLVLVINEKSISGGKSEETDEELRRRFTTDLFRNRLGSVPWYKSLATRHNSVVTAQVIPPSQPAKEHLIVENKRVVCQEDSLKFSYPGSFGVYHNRSKAWLEENRDYIVITDNQTPLPPVIEFTNSGVKNGDNVMITYRYCSVKSRNNPATNITSNLDIYVLGTSPTPVIDYTTWPNMNVFGSGSVTGETHPDGEHSKRYYIFVRQPVVDVPNEIIISGRSYIKNRDYKFVKDRGPNANSTKARDCIVWLSSLPINDRNPGFNFNYYHESVVTDIQDVVDRPDMHTAIDDVLIHSADRIPFDVHMFIEWNQGEENEDSVRLSIENYFNSVPMGSKMKIGSLIRAVSQNRHVDSVFFDSPAIKSEQVIQGRNQWDFDVPIPDGSVPELNNIYIKHTASNLYV